MSLGPSYDAPNPGPAFVGIKFCKECNNMLYPKEDKKNKVLLNACRSCEYTEIAENKCVYVSKINHEIDEIKLIVPEVISDPALPRTTEQPCPKCNYRKSVVLQSQTSRAEHEMRLYYVCANQHCTHRWTK